MSHSKLFLLFSTFSGCDASQLSDGTELSDIEPGDYGEEQCLLDYLLFHSKYHWVGKFAQHESEKHSCT